MCFHIAVEGKTCGKSLGEGHKQAVTLPQSGTLTTALRKSPSQLDVTEGFASSFSFFAPKTFLLVQVCSGAHRINSWPL